MTNPNTRFVANITCYVFPTRRACEIVRDACQRIQQEFTDANNNHMASIMFVRLTNCVGDVRYGVIAIDVRTSRLESEPNFVDSCIDVLNCGEHYPLTQAEEDKCVGDVIEQYLRLESAPDANGKHVLFTDFEKLRALKAQA